MTSTIFDVRQCAKEDSMAVEQMIKELAIYENLTDKPMIDRHMIEKDWFGDNKLYWIFVAQLLETNELIGYVFCFYKNSTQSDPTLWMKDLFVKSDYRHLGVGRVLLTAATKCAVHLSCDQLEWKCWNWNHSSIRFYKKFGGIVLAESEGWLMFRLDKQQIKEIANRSDTK